MRPGIAKRHTVIAEAKRNLLGKVLNLWPNGVKDSLLHASLAGFGVPVRQARQREDVIGPSGVLVPRPRRGPRGREGILPVRFSDFPAPGGQAMPTRAGFGQGKAQLLGDGRVKTLAAYWNTFGKDDVASARDYHFRRGTDVHKCARLVLAPAVGGVRIKDAKQGARVDID